jgi:hypothetical protein
VSSDQPAAIKVNRAPVLTLWAAVVAERLGFDADEALTLGRAVAGLNAYSKGMALGLFAPTPREVKERRAALRPAEQLQVGLLGRAVPVVQTPEGLRATSKDEPIDPASVERYLAGKLGAGLEAARQAMQALADSLPPHELARRAFELYVAFRPRVPAGERGWGASGVFDLEAIRRAAR